MEGELRWREGWGGGGTEVEGGVKGEGEAGVEGRGVYNRPGGQGRSGIVIRASGRQTDIPYLTCPYDSFSIPSQEE